MFPPMTPLGEKVRVELENQQIECEAAMRARQPRINLWHTLRQRFVSLASLLPTMQPRKRQPEFSFSDVNTSLVDEC